MRAIQLAIAYLGVLAIGTAGQVNAALITYDVEWSGASLGNSANGVGTITLDEVLVPNPGSYSNTSVLPSFITGFEITVTGASSGNGSFLLNDFQGTFWNTNGGTLDLSSELVGQATSGNPWGTAVDGSAGDFNMFRSSANAPTGTNYFRLTPAGSSDTMMLTSFSPQTAAVPEPSSLILLAMGAAGVVRLRRRQVLAG